MADGVVFDQRDAADLIRMLRIFRTGGFNDLIRSSRRVDLTPQTAIYVQNASGLECPPYACMQVTGTAEVGDQNYFTIDQPQDTTGASGRYLFNSAYAIADGEEGIAQFGPSYRMLTDGSAISSGDSWQPEINEWAVTTGGGMFVAAGADDVADDVMKGFIGSTAGSTLYRYRLSTDWTGTIPTATALIYNADLTGQQTGQTLIDPLLLMTDQLVGDIGWCFSFSGDYYAIQAPCTGFPTTSTAGGLLTINPDTFIA